MIGLSPRVRGNPAQLLDAVLGRRSIPACAGEPKSGAGFQRPAAVYPRVCGGTRNGLRLLAASPGLSPRVRGNPQPAPHARDGRRSIPACAGEPAHEPGKRDVPRVYPRVCGGTPWRFDSDPRYLIRQWNNAAPVGDTIPPARPPCPALFVAPFGLRRRAIRLLNCGVRSACRYSGSVSVSSGHPGMSAAATAQTARAACRKDLKLGSATGFTPCASSELFRSCNGRRTLS